MEAIRQEVILLNNTKMRKSNRNSNSNSNSNYATMQLCNNNDDDDDGNNNNDGMAVSDSIGKSHNNHTSTHA